VRSGNRPAAAEPASWNFQLARMKMLDDLIGNSDRNKGNLLVDDLGTST
jgi:hypothetical protein